MTSSLQQRRKYFDFGNCSDRMREAFFNTIETCRRRKFEFITPEILFYNIALQQDFFNYCIDNQISYSDLTDELDLFMSQLDTSNSPEASCMLSSDFLQMLQLLKQKLASRPKDKEIDINDILSCIDKLSSDSVAKYVLNKYMGSADDIWIDHEEAEQPARDEWKEMVTNLNETYETKNPLIGRTRELDRAIQQYLTPILMQDILFGKLAKGGNANIILNTDGLEIDR